MYSDSSFSYVLVSYVCAVLSVNALAFLGFLLLSKDDFLS